MNFITFAITRRGSDEAIFINAESIVFFHTHPDHKEKTVIGLSNGGPYTLENSIEDVKTKLGIVPKKKTGFDIA
ncbi:MAG: hypothetical protein ABR927_14610 [Bacteroidales bacterium]|jgi:uncharacterized protein YlzI (FlbEa/FlbD family)